jgi:hypothetical protein
MGYPIYCSHCKKETAWASNIVDLINNHTEKNGKIKNCVICDSSKTSISRENDLQEGKKWQRYIKAIISINTSDEYYTPYIFLTAQDKDAEIDGIHFNYYKDTRKIGGKLKHGHGPGGAPVFTRDELFQVLEKLVFFGCLSKQDFENFLKRI